MKDITLLSTIQKGKIISLAQLSTKSAHLTENIIQKGADTVRALGKTQLIYCQLEPLTPIGMKIWSHCC